MYGMGIGLLKAYTFRHIQALVIDILRQKSRLLEFPEEINVNLILQSGLVSLPVTMGPLAIQLAFSHLADALIHRDLQ